MHLRRVPHLAEICDRPGLSEYTLGVEVLVAGGTLGAQVVEKNHARARGEAGE
ncbi:sialic acid synthase SpsE [Salinibacter ruber]|nr:sialic acid synthase SpsE [Salinibacter ruber]MCS3714647.1 sialic acid synthase SpsE [Salinibacter ruber]